MNMKPLNQDEYTMEIVEDLGMLVVPAGTRKARYAKFKCTICKQPFKVRCGSSKAKAQTKCTKCTESKDQYYKHPLYAIWNGIRQRCYNTKRKDYPKYGGKGVTMSEEFKNSSTAFIEFCLQNGWNSELEVDKDEKSKLLGLSPGIYSRKTLSFIPQQRNAELANAKPVAQYTLEGTYICTHASTVKAADSVNANKSSIANACRDITKTSKNYIWKYV